MTVGISTRTFAMDARSAVFLCMFFFFFHILSLGFPLIFHDETMPSSKVLALCKRVCTFHERALQSIMQKWPWTSAEVWLETAHVTVILRDHDPGLLASSDVRNTVSPPITRRQIRECPYYVAYFLRRLPRYTEC